MASTAKILSWRFRHLNIVGCLFERRPTKEGHGHPRTPPSYAPARAVSKLYLLAAYGLLPLVIVTLKYCTKSAATIL